MGCFHAVRECDQSYALVKPIWRSRYLFSSVCFCIEWLSIFVVHRYLCSAVLSICGFCCVGRMFLGGAGLCILFSAKSPLLTLREPLLSWLTTRLKGSGKQVIARAMHDQNYHERNWSKMFSTRITRLVHGDNPLSDACFIFLSAFNRNLKDDHHFCRLSKSRVPDNAKLVHDYVMTDVS